MIIPEPEKTPQWRTGMLAGLFLLAACGEDSRRVQAEVGALLPAVILTGLTDEAPTSTSALRVNALPQTVLVTAGGTIAARITGTRDWDSAEAKRLVEQALNLRNKGVR